MLPGMERLNDCFSAGDRLLTVGEAAERLGTRLGPAVGRERIPLAEARGRILAEPLVSGLDVPGYDNAAVDGYAFAHGQARYRVAGRAAAGRQGERARYRILPPESAGNARLSRCVRTRHAPGGNARPRPRL